MVTSGQIFTPSAEAEALVTQQVQLIASTYGEKGQEIIADCQAYADGINAWKRRRRGDGVHRLDSARRRRGVADLPAKLQQSLGEYDGYARSMT